MSPKDNELMERYIYQVVRRLPKKQQNEVGMELRELIGDMLEESDSMEAVLTKLGDPAEFAKKYQDGTHCLIGPAYYDTYLWFIKIVLLCSAIPIFVISVIEAMNNGFSDVAAVFPGFANSTALVVMKGLAAGIANCVVSCVSVFGCVTLVFAIMERRNVKLDLKKQKEWSVSDLSDGPTGKKNGWTPKELTPLPHKKARISRSDSVLGIVFLVIFCILLIFAPGLFSAFIKEGETIVTVPVFNLEKWNVIMPVFVASLLIALTDEIVRLAAGCYCKTVMISNIVCGVIKIALSAVVLKVFPFWNPNFVPELETALGSRLNGTFDLLAYWDENAVSNLIFGFVTAVTLLEIGTTIYKTARYGMRPEF